MALEIAALPPERRAEALEKGADVLAVEAMRDKGLLIGGASRGRISVAAFFGHLTGCCRGRL